VSIPTPDQMVELERLVDQHTLFEVLAALAVIAGDKAEHLRANWQDKTGGRCWDNAAKALERVAKNPSVGAVS